MLEKRKVLARRNTALVTVRQCAFGVQVVRLRDENEALMETLVRAKVELAETQGASPLACPCDPIQG